MNIRMEYLYRDAGNYKNWGEVVFSNAASMPIGHIEKLVVEALFERLYFVARSAGLPDLHFTDRKVELDHDWHEFHGLAETDEPPTDLAGRSIEHLIECLQLDKLGVKTA